MSRLTPVTQRELMERLRQHGFSGPYSGGKHPYMVRGMQRLTIPNIHGSEIGVDLLSRILKQAGISREDWFASDEARE
ncbi:MAG: type II toxin-antitoxin system HicA family toxin [Rectinema sp.]|nr:type II toxin-antitoxin system HicA family toxin [Rectinema sp.]